MKKLFLLTVLIIGKGMCGASLNTLSMSGSDSHSDVWNSIFEEIFEPEAQPVTSHDSLSLNKVDLTDHVSLNGSMKSFVSFRLKSMFSYGLMKEVLLHVASNDYLLDSANTALARLMIRAGTLGLASVWYSDCRNSKDLNASTNSKSKGQLVTYTMFQNGKIVEGPFYSMSEN